MSLANYSNKTNSESVSNTKKEKNDANSKCSCNQSLVPHQQSMVGKVLIFKSEDREDQFPVLPWHQGYKAAWETIDEAYTVMMSSISEGILGDDEPTGADLKTEDTVYYDSKTTKYRRDLIKDDLGLFYEQLSRLRHEKDELCSLNSDDHEGDDNDDNDDDEKD